MSGAKGARGGRGHAPQSAAKRKQRVLAYHSSIRQVQLPHTGIELESIDKLLHSEIRRDNELSLQNREEREESTGREKREEKREREEREEREERREEIEKREKL